MYKPRYSLTVTMANDLMKIQRAATVVDKLPLPASILTALQRKSREATVILSTKIEGNGLAEPAKREALRQPGESKDSQEVYNLMKAVEFLDNAEERQLPVTEEFIKRLHALIQVIPYGRRPKSSEYRNGPIQVGQAGQDGFYLPPEAKDVPDLMEDLVAWVNDPETAKTPAPIVAGIFMYQFLTIHPYTDGNGRTARMLATYILRRAGFGLRRLFILEKYYDRNLEGYYANLQMGLHHNYYYGRNDPDLTPWLTFFLRGLAEVFMEACELVESKSKEYMAVEPKLLKALDPQQRFIFAQLAFKFNWATTSDLRAWTGFSDRTIRDKVKGWIEQGFLTPTDKSAERIRSVRLSPKYQKLAERVAKEPEKYQYLLV